MRPYDHLPEYDRRMPVNVGTHSFFSSLKYINIQKVIIVLRNRLYFKICNKKSGFI